ncbi:MAG: endolytic transglycosylase MltG [Clostridia bacterium]|nr:endolytic transglycosylase MltG [Clostridia bacterium]
MRKENEKNKVKKRKKKIEIKNFDDFVDVLRDFKRKTLLFIGSYVGTGRDTKATWQKIRPWTIYIISSLLVIVVFASAISITLNAFFGAPSKRDDSPVLFTIKSGASMSSVANNLEKEGLINSSFGIKLLADFTSVSSRIQSGEYVLDKTMTAQEILDVITKPTASARVVTVTLVEGTTVEDFAQTLVASGVISNKDSFLAACKNAKNFSDYYFVPPLYDMGNLRYSLEGYLFPDTYEFYVSSSNETVIKKLLSRLNNVYTAQYTERAEELGLSMHQVLTLASIIEKEGRGSDFAKISAVFHNRIKKGMRLESDVTVQYALGVKRLVLTSEELKVDSPYNTYKVAGIPAGPICNPGKDAIYAALNPDKTVLNENYLYFTLTDPYTGEVAYSKTYEEHVQIKNKYQPIWQAYDKAQGNK